MQCENHNINHKYDCFNGKTDVIAEALTYNNLIY